MINIYLIWDFDGPVGQINSTFPYNFKVDNFAREIANVLFISEKLNEYDIKSIFACTGFTAEKSNSIFEQRQLIRHLFGNGHEIASHSWRHEWLPIFTRKQIILSMRRSKLILEDCIGKTNSVVGFVPPHNRPMSWIRKGAYSIGDRGLYPLFWGGDIGNIVYALKEEGYKWIRISSKTKIRLNKTQQDVSGKIWYDEKLKIIQNTYTGFDSAAIQYINKSIKANKDIVISGHPAAFDYDRSESKSNFLNFLDITAQMVSDKEICFRLLHS